MTFDVTWTLWTN